MKKILIASILSASVMTMAQANDQFLTGDTKLACEAVLCLSTGSRPGECSPSIKKYFSINHKKLSDTIKGRRNFLNMCPSSNEQGMPALINAIANGAGRCDAAELNRVNRTVIKIKNPAYEPGGRCYSRWGMKSCDDEPNYIEKSVISNNKPNYCSVYFQHEWTRVGTRYQGVPQNGGRWVD